MSLWDTKKKEEGGGRKLEEEKKKRRKKEGVELKNLQRKKKSIGMINSNQAKLMNEEKWVEIKTTEMRKNVKKKDDEEN